MQNRLLQVIPEQARTEISRQGVVTSLRLTRRLYSAGTPIDAVYFPLDSVISMLVSAGEGESVEMATIGNEGVVGASLLLGVRKSIGDNVVQIAGDALRIDSETFTRLVDELDGFRRLVERYLYVLLHQIVQAGACNRLHSMEERCARWLLMMHDRADTPRFPITQEFLAEMLGVRRATANLALGALKAAGFIQYVRGQMSIADRPGLESVTCPCYDLIRREYAAIHADARNW